MHDFTTTSGDLDRAGLAFKTRSSIKRTYCGTIYLIHAIGSGRYKIGMTLNLQKRLKKLGEQAPFPLEVIASYQSSDIELDEKFLHKHFAASRVYGEWFELTANQIEEFKSICIRRSVA